MLPRRVVLSVVLVVACFASASAAHASQQPAPTTVAPQTPAPPPPAPPPPAQPSPTAPPTTPPALAPGVPGAPRLPPFAGTVVSFDRHGDRVVACVDRSNVAGKTSSAPAPPPTAPKLPPAYRIWVIEREVMQELMTTGGLCDPAWAPDGKTFAAVGPRGVFAFTQPNYEARVIVLGAMPSGASQSASTIVSKEPETTFANLSWSPSGRRLAFLTTTKGVTTVKVVDAKDGATVFSKEQPAKLVQWGADDKSISIDGTRVTLP
jgi:hypothetical protein